MTDELIRRVVEVTLEKNKGGFEESQIYSERGKISLWRLLDNLCLRYEAYRFNQTQSNRRLYQETEDQFIRCVSDPKNSEYFFGITNFLSRLLPNQDANQGSSLRNGILSGEIVLKIKRQYQYKPKPKQEAGEQR